MEYLTTYGWVILIIAIVLLALFELGIFNQNGQNSCVAQPGFICANPVYGTNAISFTFGQNSGQYYYSVNAFVASQAESLTNNGMPQNMTVPTYWVYVSNVLASGETITVVYYADTVGGGQILSNPPIGTQFSGYVWISYCTSPGCSSLQYAKVATINARESGTVNLAYDDYLSIYADPSNGGGVSPSSGFYPPGSAVPISATAASGYTFNGWSCSGISSDTCNSLGQTATVTMSNTITLIANFNCISGCSSGGGGGSPTQYYLAMNPVPSGGGSVSPGANTLWSANSIVTIDAIPSTGYTFNSWSGTGSGGYTGANNPASVTMNTDIVETASFISPVPTVTAISPNSAANIGSASITSITGTNFASDATVNLVMAGQSTIVCSGFTFTNSNTLSSGSCPISGAAAGAWNVVVTNPNGQNGILTSGFIVTLSAPSCSNPWLSGSCVGSVSYSGSPTLQGNIFVSGNVVISSGSLTTNGFIIVAGGTFYNGGTILTGSAGGGSEDDNYGTISNAINVPLSYAGSGGGGGWSDCNDGIQGGNTIVPGGLSAGEQQGGCTGYNPLPGSTPAAPTSSAALSDIPTWYDNGFKSYFDGAGGGTVGGGTCGGSDIVTGGGGAFGIYIQANSIDNVGTINANGFSGNSGGGNEGCWDAGGGGGGFVILAYNSASTITLGTLEETGGAWVGNDGCCGTGGSGNYIEVPFSTPPINP